MLSHWISCAVQIYTYNVHYKYKITNEDEFTYLVSFVSYLDTGVVVMVTNELSSNYFTAVVHQVFQGALRIFTKTIPAHVCVYMWLYVFLCVHIYMYVYVCQGRSKRSSWSGFGQTTISQGKNKVPFYKKQVINKSTRVIFGLV